MEYTEPKVLITHSHLQQAIEASHVISSVNTAQTLQRCESNDSLAANQEICTTLLQRSRTQTSEEMADEEELLNDEASKPRNTDRMMEDFDQLHLNGSLGPRRRIMPQTINKDQILNYIANTSSIFIRRSGTELQAINIRRNAFNPHA